MEASVIQLGLHDVTSILLEAGGKGEESWLHREPIRGKKRGGTGEGASAKERTDVREEGKEAGSEGK